MARMDGDIAAAKEARRGADAAAADAAFRESQAERRCAETREVALEVEARADAMADKLRGAQAHAAEVEAAAACACGARAGVGGAAFRGGPRADAFGAALAGARLPVLLTSRRAVDLRPGRAPCLRCLCGERTVVGAARRAGAAEQPGGGGGGEAEPARHAAADGGAD